MRALIATALLLGISPSIAHAGHRCTETSDVVGHSECARFGSGWWMPSWVPALFLELGIDRRTVPVPDPVPRGARVQASLVSMVDTMGPELRIGSTLSHGFYLGVQADFVAASASEREVVLAGMGAVLGLRGQLGASTVGTEIVVGGRLGAVGAVKGSLDAKTATSLDGRVVEARVRADHWLNPWIAAGAFGATAAAPLGLYGIVALMWGTLLAGFSRNRSTRQAATP